MRQYRFSRKKAPFLISFSLLCLAAIGLQGQSHPGQRLITIKCEQVRTADFFSLVWDQVRLQAFYNDEQLDSDEPVTAEFKAEPLDNVLAWLLRKKGLTWYYRSETFVIVPRKPGDPLLGKLPEEQTVGIRGMVTDGNGKPLQRATVQLSGSGKGATTDKDGRFELKIPKYNIPQLMVSCLGYEPRTVTVKDTSHPVAVQLQEKVSGLDEVMVLAYGTSSRRYLTGSVSKVTAKEIEQQPVSDPLLALQGRVPGLAITRRTGLPGGEVKVELRGRNSIAAGNNPLYIVDGIPFPGTALTFNNLQNVNRISPLMGSNPLNMISVSDIESIEVLKDADATAIYGSRGANGIILITTKKPQIGQMKLEAGVYTGFGKMANGMDYMGTKAYLAMRREAFLRDGASPHASDYDLVRWDSTRYTDWERAMLGGTAPVTDAQLALSAGSEQVQLRLSGGYRRESTVYPGDYAYQKASGRASFRVYSPDKRTRMYFTAAYVADHNRLPSLDLSFYSATAPNAPEPYTPEGLLNWDEGNFDNPYSAVKRTYKGTTRNLTAQLVLSRDLLTGLELKMALGYNRMETEEKQPNSFRYLNPAYGYGTTIGGYSYFADGKMDSWIAEPQLLYDKLYGKLSLSALIGASFQQDKREQQGFLGLGFSSDAPAQLENRTAASTLSRQGDFSYKYRYSAAFGRVNVKWDGKYIVNLTGRRDGSSRFGPGRQLANFYAIGAAWIFSEETFAGQILPFLSFGKLRASYGITGNDQIRDYGYLATYMPALLYGQDRGQWPTRLYNPSYGWEQSRKAELGLELGFLENRILLRTSWYRNISGNQLVRYPLSAVTGFPDIQENIAAKVQNTGWELELSGAIINGKGREKSITWTSGVNFSLPRNKLLAFPGLEGSAYASFYSIGFPLNTLKGYRYEGIDPESGLYLFSDAGKDGRLDAADYISHTTTGVLAFGGWQNSFQYGNFSLDVFFQYVRQNAFNYLLASEAPPGFAMTNQPAATGDRWTGAGDRSAAVQRYTQQPGDAARAYANARLSDRAFTGASFLRLKNIQLCYRLPEGLLQRRKLQSVQLFLQGQNVLTVTGYKGRDPEVAADSDVYPPLRVWTLGARLGL